METRHSSKILITLLLSVTLAHGLIAQTWTIGNKTGTRHMMANAHPAPTHMDSRGVAPVNDECSGAVIVDLAIDASVVRTGDNTGATDSYGDGNDVWEAFTITECANVTVDFCGTTPAWAAPRPGLYVGCGPLLNLVFIGNDNIHICGDGNFTFTFPQLTPGTYYYGVSDVEGATGPYQITLSAVACSGSAPANDDCSGAVELSPSLVCAPVDGDVAGATISGGSIPGPGCGGSDASDDVWYSFVATATEHSIIVDPSDEMDVVIELRNGDCAGSTVLACEDVAYAGDPEQLDATGLTIGTTYFVRVYDWLAGVPVTTTFTICLLGPGGCEADAATITADESEVCLVGGTATISATPDGNANVPAGFLTVYALTQGPELLIIDAALTPTFDVTAAGAYTIHTLVYDPNTLDLSGIEFGVSTAFDVDAMLLQGGGGICGSLDMTGAAIMVNVCIICDQSAGAITADASPVCLVSGTVDISATPDGNSIVPIGYETIYVLTQGPGLVIIETAANPAFTATAEDTYTIHTLVYDPLTLDLGIVEIGVTSAFEIDALLVQGGGTICASLDLVGAPIEVQDCTPANDDCANATDLVINAVDDCPGNALFGDNTYASQDGVEPGCDTGSGAGYLDVWYTFNSGNNSSVTVNFDPGAMEDWAITITEGCGGDEVYCEVTPAAPIELTTTASTTYVVRIYSNLDFGGGGEFSICVTGAEPTVVCDGGDVQTIDAMTAVTVCQDVDADVIEFATSSVSSESYAFALTDESNIIVTMLAGNSLDFNSAPLGNYRVWGISYNGDLVGADPGMDVTAVTSTGACIDPSNNFVTVTVEICSGIGEGASANWGIFPNPGNGDFTLSYSGADASTVIEVIDMGGRIVHQERVAMVRGQRYPIALGGQLAQGIYSVRLTNIAGSAALRMTVR